MTAPIISSVQVDNLTLYIIFDRAIQATPTLELNGFTFLKNGLPNLPVFSVITQNALICTLGAPLIGGDTFTTQYVSGSGTVVDAATGLDPAVSFGPLAYTAYPVVPVIFGAVIGVDGNNNVLGLITTEPTVATDGNFLTGITVTIDAVPISLVGVTVTVAPGSPFLFFTFPSNFTYDDDVVISYDGLGTLYSYNSGAVGAFTQTPANLSTDGLPNSAYPLSFVTNYAIEMISTTARGRLGVSLNPVDIQLVKEYGPAIVLTGGTFGITMSNPSGVTVLGKAVAIVDGADIIQDFFVANQSAWSIAAAKDWEAQITVKIGIELGRLRAIAQSVTLGDDVVVSV